MPDPDLPIFVRATEDAQLTHHAPQYVYEARCPIYSSSSRVVICQLTSNTRESFLWCQDENEEGGCKAWGEWTQLRKSFQSQGISFPRVWQDIGIPNPTTGKIESDPRKFREHLHVASEKMSERLNMPVDYQPVDLNDRDALNVTDEGLDSTHDQAVKDGRKDSRGRFVW